MLPLVKGHLSNTDRILWQKGVSLLEGDYCTIKLITDDVVQVVAFALVK